MISALQYEYISCTLSQEGLFGHGKNMCDMHCKKPFFTCRFICKNNGVLFENDLLQIGVKSEYRQNLGRLGIFYGNKTSFQFSGFSIDTQCPGELASHILYSQ